MTDFIETPRFPENISEGSGGGPGFKTDVYVGMSGVEQRNQNWQRSRAAYTVAYDVRDQTDMNAVRDFFYNMRGKAIGFRYKDWNDYVATGEPTVIGYDDTNEPIATGVGDGTNKIFRLCKTYAGVNPYSRRIFKPVDGTVVVYNNGAVVSSGYTLDTTTGTINFGTAPLAGHVITADFEFDVPCRFDTDNMVSTQDAYLIENWTNIPVIELKFEDADA